MSRLAGCGGACFRHAWVDDGDDDQMVMVTMVMVITVMVIVMLNSWYDAVWRHTKIYDDVDNDVDEYYIAAAADDDDDSDDD